MIQVRVYIFRADDGLSSEQRLHWSVAQFCGELRAEDADENVHLENIENMKVERTAAGKPYFPEYPRIHFSISHSGEYWACAVADANIGLDLQKHVLRKGEKKQDAEDRWNRMAHRFFHPVEASFAEASFVEADGFKRFFAVWAAREAYVKNTGQGIDRDFSKYCVIPEKWGRRRSDDAAVNESASWKSTCSEWTWSAIGKKFRFMVYDDEYSLCVCADSDFEWKNVEFEKDCYC